ncbi:unnamed protein product [Amoebophrya sp. A120]|nr:unnamed protein product [Amoebophrya sp. A120]|eukprot:GSA120T00014699001.1
MRKEQVARQTAFLRPRSHAPVVSPEAQRQASREWRDKVISEMGAVKDVVRASELAETEAQSRINENWKAWMYTHVEQRKTVAEQNTFAMLSEAGLELLEGALEYVAVIDLLTKNHSRQTVPTPEQLVANLELVWRFYWFSSAAPLHARPTTGQPRFHVLQLEAAAATALEIQTLTQGTAFDPRLVTLLRDFFEAAQIATYLAEEAELARFFEFDKTSSEATTWTRDEVWEAARGMLDDWFGQQDTDTEHPDTKKVNVENGASSHNDNMKQLRREMLQRAIISGQRSRKQLPKRRKRPEGETLSREDVAKMGAAPKTVPTPHVNTATPVAPPVVEAERCGRSFCWTRSRRSYRFPNIGELRERGEAAGLVSRGACATRTGAADPAAKAIATRLLARALEAVWMRVRLEERMAVDVSEVFRIAMPNKNETEYGADYKTVLDEARKEVLNSDYSDAQWSFTTYSVKGPGIQLLSTTTTPTATATGTRPATSGKSKKEDEGELYSCQEVDRNKIYSLKTRQREGAQNYLMPKSTLARYAILSRLPPSMHDACQHFLENKADQVERIRAGKEEADLREDVLYSRGPPPPPPAANTTRPGFRRVQQVVADSDSDLLPEAEEEDPLLDHDEYFSSESSGTSSTAGEQHQEPDLVYVSPPAVPEEEIRLFRSAHDEKYIRAAGAVVEQQKRVRLLFKEADALLRDLSNFAQG